MPQVCVLNGIEKHDVISLGFCELIGFYWFILQRIAWTVAALVMIINGYLLLDFFVSEVNGFMFGVTVCVWTTAYVAFIVYLISHSNFIPSPWSSSSSIELP